ncbi:hypothetical protein ABDM08_004244 [Salmonella enterica]|nr:hypothetical protein [Salmonella enterica]EJQ9383907.1 hypothetical protein [Salmonella enterica]
MTTSKSEKKSRMKILYIPAERRKDIEAVVWEACQIVKFSVRPSVAIQVMFDTILNDPDLRTAVINEIARRETSRLT